MKGSILLIGAAALFLMQKKPITSQAAGSAAVEYINNPIFDQDASNTLVDYANNMSRTGSNNLDIFNKLVNNYNTTLQNGIPGYTAHDGELVKYSTNEIPPVGAIGLFYSQGSGYYGAGYYPNGFDFNLPPGIYPSGFNYANKTIPIGWNYNGNKATPVY